MGGDTIAASCRLLPRMRGSDTRLGAEDGLPDGEDGHVGPVAWEGACCGQEGELEGGQSEQLVVRGSLRPIVTLCPFLNARTFHGGPGGPEPGRGN